MQQEQASSKQRLLLPFIILHAHDFLLHQFSRGGVQLYL